MRLALAIEGGFKQTGDSFTVAVEPEIARILAGFFTVEVLIAPIAGDTDAVGAARLLGIETDAAGSPIARFAAGRRLGSTVGFADSLRGPFPLQLLADDGYSAIVAVAGSGIFARPDATPSGEMTDLSVAFSHAADPEEPPVKAVLETLRRETGNLCALTGGPLLPDAIPAAIRCEGANRLHLNNLLLLSPAAEAAFREGHVTVRDDFSIIVDFRRIDPELLELINPDGRLRLPRNPALWPSAENFAWHRRHVFRLG